MVLLHRPHLILMPSASVLALGADAALFAGWDLRLRAGAQAVGVQVAPLGSLPAGEP